MSTTGTILAPRWLSVRQAAELLGYGTSKVKTLVMTGQLRSVKDGKYRKIMPEWVDDYIARRIDEQAA